MKRNVFALLLAALLVIGFLGLASAQDATTTTLNVQQNEKYGQYLTDANGRALYMFSADTQGQGQEQAVSTCNDACAEAWPPLTAQQAPQAGETVQEGMISTIERTGGQMQVTYNGWPLYYYANDEGAGATTGQDVEGFGGEWYLVSPEGTRIQSQDGAPQSG